MRRTWLLGLALTVLGCGHRAPPAGLAAFAGPEPPAPLAPPAPPALIAAAELRDDPPGDQLPASIFARAYRLAVDVTDPARYRGTVELDLVLARPTSQLWVHADGPDVTAASLLPHGGHAVAISAVALPHQPVVRIELGQVMAGEVTVRLTFEQQYRGGGAGLVRLGDTVVARLDAGARTAWPCLDDANAQATWRVSWRVPAGHQVIGASPVPALSPDGAQTFRAVGAPRQLGFAIGAFEGTGRVYLPPGAGGLRTGRFLDDEVGERARVVTGAIGRSCWPRDELQVAYVAGLGEAAHGLGVTVLDASLIVDDDRAPHEAAALAALTHGLASQCFGVRRQTSGDDDAWLTPALAAWATEAALRTLRGEADVDATWRGSRRQMLLAAQAAEHTLGPETLATLRDPPTRSPLVRGRGARVVAALAAWTGDEAWRRVLTSALAAPSRSTLTLADLLLAGLPIAALRVIPTLAGSADVPTVSIARTCLGGELTAQISSAMPLDVPMCLRSSAPGTAPVCAVVTGHDHALRLPGTCADAIVPNAGGEGLYQLALDDLGVPLLVGSVPLMTAHERASLATDLIMQLVDGTATPRQVAAALLPGRLTGDGDGLDEAWWAMLAAVAPGERARFQRWLHTAGRKAAAAQVPRFARTDAAWARATDRPQAKAAARARAIAPTILRTADPTADVDATLWLAAQAASGKLLALLMGAATGDGPLGGAARDALSAVRDPGTAKIVLAWALARDDGDVATKLVARAAEHEPLAVALAPQVERGLRATLGDRLGMAAGWACRSSTFADMFARLTASGSPLVERMRPSYQLCTMLRAAA